VPQVASETIAHPSSHSFRPARPGTGPGNAPASAFENILDENARAAVERPNAGSVAGGARPELPEKSPPTAESRPAEAGRTAARSTDGETADAKAAESGSSDSKLTDAKPADDKSGEPKEIRVAAAEPVLPVDAAAEAEAAVPVDSSGTGEAGGESKETKAGNGPVLTAGEQTTVDPDVVDDGEPAADSGNGTGDTDTTGLDLTGPKTAPAAAPTPTAAAHSENAAHAADVAAGRTAPAAAAALQAAASKPADAQARNEDKKAAGLPPQAKAEDAPGRGEQKPALPEHVELPAQSHRNASPDNAAMPAPNNAHAAAKAAADATQPLVLAASAHQQQPAQAPAVTAAVPQAAPQASAVPLAGVAIEIASRALAGKNRFEIRLDPPELGRIDVRLDVGRDGRVTSHLVVDRADTLNLLQRDAAGLQRALQDAGLKTGDDGLQFSLRDQSAGQQQERAERGDTARLVVEDESLPTIETFASTRPVGRDSGIDIRV